MLVNRLTIVAAASTALALGAGLGVPAAAPVASSTPPVIRVDLAKTSAFALVPTLRRSPAGRVTFAVRNDGKVIHELVVIKLRKGQAKLASTGTKVSEKSLIGETGDLASNATKRITLTLARGHYALVCNLPGHYGAGMHSMFTVA